PGAAFVPLAFESPCIPDLKGPAGCPPNRFYAYGVVARLAQLAAAVEVEQLIGRPAATAVAATV
ncbi:MAG: glutamate--cysteine ligase, partial [Burkholderiales bacterium]|nr:glutamate--cysteine ligase [Burkholderiales bacterium]